MRRDTRHVRPSMAHIDKKYPSHLGSQRTPILDVQSVHLALPLPYALRSASTTQGGEARPLFISFGPRGTSGGLPARRPAAATDAAAAAAATAAAAAAAAVAAANAASAAVAAAAGATAAAAAAGIAAATTATRCPRLALVRGHRGRRFYSDTLASAPPSADPPPVAPRRLVPFPAA